MTARRCRKRAAREMFEDLFAGDLPGTGRWHVAGATIDPASLAVPSLNIVSTTDRIVPAATAVRAGERLELALGHVGMVVGSRAPQCCGNRWPAGFPALQQAARGARPKSETQPMTDVVITAAKRTPVGSFLGAFAATPAHELGRVAIRPRSTRPASRRKTCPR